MRAVGVLVSLLALAACGEKEAADCRSVRERVHQCYENAVSSDAEFKWDVCIPYSEPEIISGRFASAFEFNQFWENPVDDTQDPWAFPVPATKLDIDRPPFTNEAGEKIGTVTAITFEGRRPLCEIVPEERWLIVDRVISEKIISTAAYGP